MDRFTLWEKAPICGWQPAMTYPGLEQARRALAAWAEDFVDEYGLPPVPGRDFRLTQDLDLPLGLDRPSPRPAQARPSPSDIPPARREIRLHG